MRHQALLFRDGAHQLLVGLDLVDGRQAQALQLGDEFQNLADERAERRRPRKIGAVRRDVDAGQHDLAASARHEAANLRHDLTGRHRARRSAPVRNDAERAAVIAAVLHLHVGAGARPEAVDEMPGRLAHAHDVVDLHALGARR